MSDAPAPFRFAEALPLLERTPRLVDALLRGLPDGWLAADEGPETWSPPVVVGHLIHGERTDWMPRVRHLLEHGESLPFTPFDRFAQLRAAPRPIGDALDEFAALRRENLAALAALQLTETDLDRRGRHPALATVTLGQLLATWVVHDLDHLVQIERTLAKRWRVAVGPWAAYLRVVQ